MSFEPVFSVVIEHSAICATCSGSRKQRGGSGCGSTSLGVLAALTKIAFFVSFQPVASRCTPGPQSVLRVRMRPPSNSTIASDGTTASPSMTPFQSRSSAASRSSATSRQMRSTVFVETCCPSTRSATIVTRLSDRNSAFRITNWRLNPGVDARGSKPSFLR